MNTTPCCDDFRRLSRRSLLTGGAALTFGGAVVTFAGASTAQASAVRASAAPAKASSVLVVLSLRGAADGLSLVVPYTDPVYYAARPVIAVRKEALLATDGTFGLHPQLAPLLPLWNTGQLAAVNATGLPAPNRSHFAAMEEVEDADPGSAKRQGWLNRLLGTVPGRSPLQGFNLGGGVLPTSLMGAQPVMAGRSADTLNIAGKDEWDDGSRERSLRRMWSKRDDALGSAMTSAFSSVRDFAPARATPDHTSAYPNTDLGRALAQVARVIRGNVGVSVVTVDHGDWDMHSGLGSLEWGAMRSNAAEFAGALAAFMDDLGDQNSKVTVVALSEFGRRVQENANYGLDHGYGNVMFVAGAGVRGGRYYGTMLPLVNEADADVTVTTDYRSVLSEIVTTRFGASRASVFPSFQPEAVGVMG